MSILDEIFAHKRLEVERRKQEKPLAKIIAEAEQAAPALDFLDSLRNPARPVPALIAEVKRASPSKGILSADFDPLRLACIYQQNGAAAISVLTDERYFQGILADLRCLARLEPRLPLLRKDFIYDSYQVYEARASGADAVLLIAAYLEPSLLRTLHALTLELGMAPLVEVHQLDELAVALACKPFLVGVNNRNLHDFSVDLNTSLRLKPSIPPEICVVSESGIHTPQDVERLGSAGVDAILVGEALVTAQDIAGKVRSLARVEGWAQ